MSIAPNPEQLAISYGSPLQIAEAQQAMSQRQQRDESLAGNPRALEMAQFTDAMNANIRGDAYAMPSDFGRGKQATESNNTKENDEPNSSTQTLGSFAVTGHQETDGTTPVSEITIADKVATLKQRLQDMSDGQRLHLDSTIQAINSPALSTAYAEINGESREASEDQRLGRFVDGYEKWYEGVATQESERALGMYEAYKQRVVLLVEKGVLPALPKFKGKENQSIQIIDPIQAVLDRKGGEYDYENDTVHLEVGFSQMIEFHELNHREIGEFKMSEEAKVIPINEALIQMLTRAELNDGDLVLHPPEGDAYEDDQEGIALLCEGSQGKVDIKDFLAVHVAPDSEKADYFNRLLLKVQESYPGEDNVLLQGIIGWYQLYNVANQVGAGHGMSHSIASEFLKKYIAQQVDQRQLHNLKAKDKPAAKDTVTPDELTTVGRPGVTIKPSRLVAWRGRRQTTSK